MAHPDMLRWGSSGGVTAFSLGSTTCNVGTCWLNFNGDEPNYPVLAQSLYRLKGGRFEMIGRSWIKHFGGALRDPRAGDQPVQYAGLSPTCPIFKTASDQGFESYILDFLK